MSITWRCLPDKTCGKKQSAGKKKKCFLKITFSHMLWAEIQSKTALIFAR